MTASEPLVLLDFWGVIGAHQEPADVAAMAALAGAETAAFADAYWTGRDAYDAGQESGPYWRGVGERLGAVLPEERIAGLIALDVASWQRLDDDMLAAVASLAEQGRRLALLSNAPHELVGWVRSGPLSAWVPQMLFSCELGVAKPDPEAFLAAARALDVDPRDIVFVDDREENAAAARGVGMQAVRHESVAVTMAALGAGGWPV